MKVNLHDIRQEYAKRELSVKECLANPLDQFKLWLDEAISAEVNEPTAMNIATVDANGHPSARIVLLKEINHQGFVFFSNYQSRKGQAIEHYSFVALTFFWPELERQVRVVGKIERLAGDLSDEYFASRPYTSRIGAWASEQSQVLSSKTVLVSKAALIGAKHPLKVPRPPYWGGYLIIADELEFWQGRPSRLHDRVQYLLNENNQWIKQRLYP